MQKLFENLQKKTPIGVNLKRIDEIGAISDFKISINACQIRLKH